MEFNLIIRKITNLLTIDEEIIFNEWLNGSDTHRMYFENVIRDYDKEINSIDVNQSWDLLTKKINERGIKPIKNSKSVLLRIIAVAASLSFLVGISFLLCEQDPLKKSIDKIEQYNVIITTGSHKAILTLSNGQ